MTTPEQGAPAGRQGWRRHVHAVFAERLGLKATALVVSVLLWLVVGARQPTETYVPVHVIPELDSSLVLLGEPPVMRALVAGRGSDLAKLYAIPLVVRRTVSGDVPDTLMLDVSPADVRVPADLKSGIRVLDVEPRSVMLRFEVRASRHVAIVNEGRVSVGGGGAAIVRFDPETVRITGPRRLVRSMRGISPTALTIAAGDTLPHMAVLDTAGLGVRVSPAEVKVKVRARGNATAAAP